MRLDAGLTQRQFAARLGREQSFVSRLEKGERRIDLLEWVWLCQALGRDPVEEGAGLLTELARRHPFT